MSLVSLGKIRKEIAVFPLKSTVAKIKGCIKIGVHTGKIGEGVHMLMQCLRRVAKLGRMPFLTPLAWTSIGLQTLIIPLRVQNMAAAHQLSNQIKTVSHKSTLELNLSDYQRMVSLIEQREIKEKGFIARNFRVSRGEFKANMQEVQEDIAKKLTSDQPEDKLEGQRKIGLAAKALRQRLTTKIHSNILSMAQTVAEIAGMILLCLPPSALIGLGLIAFGLGIGLANVAYKEFKQKKFIDAMNSL